jgi:hypothetical protein
MTFSEALSYAISGVVILAIWIGLMLLLRRIVWWYWGILTRCLRPCAQLTNHFARCPPAAPTIRGDSANTIERPSFDSCKREASRRGSQIFWLLDPMLGNSWYVRMAGWPASSS